MAQTLYPAQATRDADAPGLPQFWGGLITTGSCALMRKLQAPGGARSHSCQWSFCRGPGSHQLGLEQLYYRRIRRLDTLGQLGPGLRRVSPLQAGCPLLYIHSRSESSLPRHGTPPAASPPSASFAT